MSSLLFQVYTALFMVVVAIGLVVLFRGSQAVASLGRMTRMMKRSGLESGMAARDAPMMKAARRRCKNCRFEDRCELWLEGAGEGDNSFCPNAPMLQSLT